MRQTCCSCAKRVSSRVQRVRGGEVVAERFLDDDALPAGTVLVQQAGAMHLLDNFAELAGQGGQIKQQVLPQRRAAERGQQFFQLFVSRRVGDVALAIKQAWPRTRARPFRPPAWCGKTGRARRAIPRATIRPSFRAAQNQ